MFGCLCHSATEIRISIGIQVALKLCQNCSPITHTFLNCTIIVDFWRTHQCVTLSKSHRHRSFSFQCRNHRDMKVKQILTLTHVSRVQEVLKIKIKSYIDLSQITKCLFHFI